MAQRRNCSEVAANVLRGGGAAASGVRPHNGGALLDDLRKITLIDLKLHPMRLRQVLGRQFNLCAYVSHLVGRFEPDPQFRLEGLKPSSVAFPLVQTATLPSESLDVGDHQNRALNPDTGSRSAAVAGDTEPFPSSASSASANWRPCTHSWKPAIFSAGGPSSLFETCSNRPVPHHGQCQIEMNELPPSWIRSPNSRVSPL